MFLHNWCKLIYNCLNLMLRVINIRVVVPERVRRKDYECLLFTSHLFLPSLYTIWRNKGTFNHIYSYQCSTFLFHSLLQLYISHHFRWRFAEFIKSCVGKRVRAIPFIHNVFISSAQYCMSPNSGSQIMNRDSWMP